MAGPWEKYGGATVSNGPWSRYGASAEAQTPTQGAVGALGKLAEALSSETYMKKAGVPEMGSISLPTKRENKITYLPQGGIDYGPTKVSDETFTGRGVLGGLVDIAAQEGLARMAKGGLSALGRGLENAPLKKIDTYLKMNNKMPLTQVLKEEGIPASRLMNKENILNEAAGLERQYAAARGDINKIIDASGNAGNIREAMGSAQAYLDSLASDRSKDEVRTLLQKDLDAMYAKYNGTPAVRGISGTELAGERAGVSGAMSPEDFQILGNSRGVGSTYNKLKGGGMLEQSANLAEAAQPGLGQNLLDLGQKQSSIITSGKMLKQGALSEAGKVPINAVGGALLGGGHIGEAAGLEGVKLMRSPGAMIGAGRGLQYTANAVPNFAPSTWLELYKRQLQEGGQ